MQTNDLATVDWIADPAHRFRRGPAHKITLDEHAPRRDLLTVRVKNFAGNRFPAMNDVIVKCLEEYEAEQGSGQ